MKVRATVICRRADRLLFVSKATSNWAIPGGRPEDGATLEAAAARELFEETTLRALSVCYLFEFTGQTTEHHVFHADIDEVGVATPAREIARCEWFDMQQLMDSNTSVPTKAIIEVVSMVPGQLRSL